MQWVGLLQPPHCSLFKLILLITFIIYTYTGFPGGSVVKDWPANAEDAGSIPGSVRSPKGWAIHSSTLAWEILWTEEPGGLQSMELQRVRHDLATNKNNTYIAFSFS